MSLRQVDLFFTNDGSVIDLTPTPPRELGNVAKLDAADFKDNEVSVFWPIRFGAYGSAYAQEFLHRLDVVRGLPLS